MNRSKPLENKHMKVRLIPYLTTIQQTFPVKIL